MANRKILIVEDEAVAALEMKELLESNGYEPSEPVASANKVVEAALNNHIDLILMDINLKSFIDGIDAAQRIKLMKTIPVIFLTAYPNSAIKERALKTNPAAYLEKPVSREKLLQTIEDALSNERTPV